MDGPPREYNLSTIVKSIAALVLSAGASAAFAASNLLVNGDFEDGLQAPAAMGFYGYVGSLPVGWGGGGGQRFPTTVYNSGDYLYGTADNPPGQGSMTMYPTTRVPNASSGSHLLAVGYSTILGAPALFASGGLNQSVTVKPGEQLTLSYDYQAGDYGAAVDLYDLSNYNVLSYSQISRAAANGWTHVTITATTSLSTIGVAIHGTNGGIGASRSYVDNVVLSATAVPEAGTLSMMALGLCGLVGVTRRQAQSVRAPR